GCYVSADASTIAGIACAGHETVCFQAIHQLGNVRLYAADSAGQHTQWKRLSRLNQMMKYTELGKRKAGSGQSGLDSRLETLCHPDKGAYQWVKTDILKTADFVHG